MAQELRLKTINELLGNCFYIPKYQRGYRWSSHQVTQLLDDIETFAKTPLGHDQRRSFYCLQPIVVKEIQWPDAGVPVSGWEVIDGQQRLTTIFILLSYFEKEFLGGDFKNSYLREIFTFRYETRRETEQFLKDIREDRSCIDYNYIWSAYKTIATWFKGKSRTEKNRFLDTLLATDEFERSVQVIWHEVDTKETVKLFTRLNLGKIPLTNAELVKALFLSNTSFNEQTHEDAARSRMEIALIWDEIEQKLGDEMLWSFVTNAKPSDYPTRIDLLFDLISNRPARNSDPLHTFLYFLKQFQDQNVPLWTLWLDIENYFQTLCYWATDKDLYHKVGYLIAIGDADTLPKLASQYSKSIKPEFNSHLDRLIEKSIDFDLDSLSYERAGDYRKLERALLLFNVETIRNSKNIAEYYPFKFHKNLHWSLEHIHAQNSQFLDQTKKRQWTEWIKNHRPLVQELATGHADESVQKVWKRRLEELDSFDEAQLTWLRFSTLADEIFKDLTENGPDERHSPHSISNLALLSKEANSALNNAVFEVKRRVIIHLDKEGEYIPVCTRRVFLKYYNDNERSSSDQIQFWGMDDRASYLEKIKKILSYYRTELVAETA